jgi:FOG: WD40 repeat
MRNFILLITFFLATSFSALSQSDIIEKSVKFEKENNITNVEFGRENDLFALDNNKQVKKLNIDLATQSFLFDVEANSIGTSNLSNIIALGKTDGTLLFFDNEKQIKSYKAHNSPITFITFSPLDNFIATSSLGSKIKIWSAKTYDLLQEIDITTGLVTDLKFSLDEKLLVYSTNKGKVVVWNLKDQKNHSMHKISNKWIRNIAICPDGIKYAVCGDDKKITILSFKNNDYYQLEKSHINIITNIEFIDQNYLISIGHDHRVVMNNINVLVEKEELKHFKGHPKYKKYLHDLQGDKYFSNLSISNEQKLVAVSSYGRGIALTGYFHDLIENPYEIYIKAIDNNIVDVTNVRSEFMVKRSFCIIQGKITRPEGIKNAWIYYAKYDTKTKLKIDKDGDFKFQTAVFDEINDYSIIVENWDKNLSNIQYDFRVIKRD